MSSSLDEKSTAQYLHGYAPEEQARLYVQAKMLAPSVFGGIEFAASRRILEVGCGVGAQTEFLLERFPDAHVVSVDRSPEQITQAQAHFLRHPSLARVEFHEGDATALSFGDAAFDGAFLCWILEHVPSPMEVLKEVRRCLKPGSPLHLNEVFNQLMYLHPQSSAVTAYWMHFNQLQLEMGGDPYVGAKLGHYLQFAGFREITVHVERICSDSRDPAQRRLMFEYWQDLLMSAAPSLLDKRRVDQKLVEEVRAELKSAGANPDAVLFLGWIKASAVA